MKGMTLRPTKIVLLVAAIALIAAACSGGSDDSSSGGTEGGGGGGDATLGEPLFQGTCSACHGPDAMGIEGLGKQLVASEFIQARTDDEMVAFIIEGRAPDHPDNTTGVAMLPRGGNPSLSDDDLYDIVAFLRTLQ